MATKTLNLVSDTAMASAIAVETTRATDAETSLNTDLSDFTGNERYAYTKDKSIAYGQLVPGQEIGWESAIIDCNEGDTFCVKGYGGNSTRLWFFEKSDGTVVSASDTGLHTTDYICITAPSGAEKLVVNSKYTEIDGDVYKGIKLKEDVEDIKGTVVEIESDIADIKKKTGGTFSASTETAYIPYIRLTFDVTVIAGETVTVKAEYSGDNATVYDIRFYDTDGTVHLIKSNFKFGDEYVFTADMDYATCDLYETVTTYKAGETISCTVKTSGEISVDLSKKQNNLTAGDNIEIINDVISANAADGTMMYKNTNIYSNTSIMVGRVFQGVYNSAITSIYCTDYIPIIGGHTYTVYGGYINEDYSNYYDADKVYKGALDMTHLINKYPYDGGNNALMFTAPSDAKYTRINFFASTITDEKLPDEYTFYDVTYEKYAGKNVLIIGDSISTDYYGSYRKWVTDLASDGFFSTAFYTNDSIHATGFAADTGGDTFPTRLNAYVTAGTAPAFDSVVVFGGVNDYIQKIPMEDFKIAVDGFFETLINNFTQASICVLLPLMISYGTTETSEGYKLKDYVDYIKTVCDNYCLPRLDLFNESGFCPQNETFKNKWTLLPSGYTEHDGVHPIEEWEKSHLAPRIKAFLETLT